MLIKSQQFRFSKKEEISKIGYLQTNSEIEALILEASLIKKYQPKYNIVWRDDKNYFFVAKTREDFPRIFLTEAVIKFPKDLVFGISLIGVPLLVRRKSKSKNQKSKTQIKNQKLFKLKTNASETFEMLLKLLRGRDLKF